MNAAPQRRQKPDDPANEAEREIKKGLWTAFGFSLALNLLVLTSPLYMMQVYDRVLASGSYETLALLTMIAAAALMAYGALEAVRSMILARIARWLGENLSGKAHDLELHFARLGGQAARARPRGDLDAAKRAFGNATLNPIFDAPWAPIFIALIWSMHWMLGVLALLAALLLFALAVLNESISKKPTEASRQIAIPAMRRMEAAREDAAAVHAMGMMKGLQAWRARDEEKAEALQLQAADRNGGVLGASKFLRMMVQVGILGLGAFLTLQQQLSPGGMIAGSILLGRALAPMEQAIGAWGRIMQSRSAWARFKNALHMFPKSVQTVTLPEVQGRLSAEKLIYAPEGASEATIKNVSFTLEPGEFLGVIGPSGGGKSTLCHLLVGAWTPRGGHVRLDGAELHSWNPEQLGAAIGYLPQTVELYPASIKDNVARFQDATDAEIIEAAKAADVHDLILSLPDGYGTMVGEGGVRLSGGQIQRIGLARAFFRRPKLLVLDEPNTGLDADGEAALLRAIDEARKHKTTVVLVAHKPAIVARADKILVLKDGAMAAFGPRDEVLSQVTPLKRPQPAATVKIGAAS